MTRKPDKNDDRRPLAGWLWTLIWAVLGILLAICVITILTSPFYGIFWANRRSEQSEAARQTRAAQTSTAETIAAQRGTAQTIAQQTGVVETGTAQAIAQQTAILQTSTAEVIVGQTATAQASVAQTSTAQVIASQTEAEQTSIAQTGTAEASAGQASTAEARVAQTNTAEASLAQTSTAQTSASQTGTVSAAAAQTATVQANTNGTRIAQTTGTAQANLIQTSTAEASATQTSVAQIDAEQTRIAQTRAAQNSGAAIGTAQAGATQTRIAQTRVAQIRETTIASASGGTSTPDNGSSPSGSPTPRATITPPRVFFQVRGQDYIVQADDWLSKLSLKFYGSALAYWPIIAATNQASTQDPTYDRIDDPDFIEIGDKLLIPAADIAEDFMNNYEIGSGLPETIVDDDGILRIQRVILPTVVPAPPPPPGAVPPPLPPTATPSADQALIVPTIPADSTPVPPPNGNLTLIAPISLDQPTFGPISFIWEWNGDPLPPAYSFEVRVWVPGAVPTGVHDAVADSQTGRIEQIGTNRYQLDISNIRAAEGVQGQAGIYLWTVQLVRVAPDYAEFGLQAEPTQLRIETSGP